MPVMSVHLLPHESGRDARDAERGDRPVRGGLNFDTGLARHDLYVLDGVQRALSYE
jgi:hypothetical protein